MSRGVDADGQDCRDPYYEGEANVIEMLMRKIRQMLTVQPVGNSEQLPRVLTKREAYEWMKDGRPHFMEANRDYEGTWLTPVNYGRGWRCWTSQPEEEQRRATPWHD